MSDDLAMDFDTFREMYDFEIWPELEKKIWGLLKPMLVKYGQRLRATGPGAGAALYEYLDRDLTNFDWERFAKGAWEDLPATHKGGYARGRGRARSQRRHY